MKRLLIITLLLLSVGLSQNRVNVNNLVRYGDKYYKENDDRPYNGIVFDMSIGTGNKILQYKMVDGLKNGLYQEWYPHGKPKSKGKYLNEIKNGKWTSWDKNGENRSELTYKDGKVWEGKYIRWYENGQKKEEVTFKDGKVISKKEWNEDGSVKE